MSADARVPLERASGSISCHARYVPFHSTKWDQLFPVIQTGHRSVLACQVRVCFSCRQGFGVASGLQGQSDPVAAPPWRRRWCKSGEDVWGNLLLHVCQKDSVVSSFNPSFVAKISRKERPGCLILKFLSITLTSELFFYMLIWNSSRWSWFIWKSEGTLKPVTLVWRPLYGRGSFCVETCLVFFTWQNRWIWPSLDSYT